MVIAIEDHSLVGALGQGPCTGRVLDAEKVGYGIKQLDTKWAAPQGYYLLGRAGDTRSLFIVGKQTHAENLRMLPWCPRQLPEVLPSCL